MEKTRCRIVDSSVILELWKGATGLKNFRFHTLSSPLVRCVTPPRQGLSYFSCFHRCRRHSSLSSCCLSSVSVIESSSHPALFPLSLVVVSVQSILCLACEYIHSHFGVLVLTVFLMLAHVCEYPLKIPQRLNVSLLLLLLSLTEAVVLLRL